MLLNSNTINICLSCDNKYAKYAGVVIASILSNANTDDWLVFYILDGGIKPENRQKIQDLKAIKDCEINFIKVDKSLFGAYKELKTHSYITLATYYRLKLPSLLPNVNKIIYFDCDFVINSSLKDLFATDMEEFPIAGVHDIKKKMVKKNPTYVNAGMLIFNLKKVKELDLETKFLHWTEQNCENIKCGDQTIINEVCRGQIKILEDTWNVQSSNFTNRSSYIKNPKCIHFVSKRKPWHFGSFSYHKSYYFKYLQMTPWALSNRDRIIWGNINQIVSLIKYFGYRPLFLLRPKFYQALYYTYIKPLFAGGEQI